jgi:hypothetical protein
MPAARRLFMTARRARRWLALASIAALGGCAWISAGDYKLFKVAITQSTKGDGCYGSGKPDPNSAGDSDTTMDVATWTITIDTNDNLFLDVGGTALQGAKSDSGYRFEAKKVDVTYDNDDATQTKHTATVDTVIDMAADGESIGGTIVVTTKQECKGSACGATVPSCTVTQRYSGTQVDDVKLYYDVK